jgi:hypothetical protein
MVGSKSGHDDYSRELDPAIHAWQADSVPVSVDARPKAGHGD